MSLLSNAKTNAKTKKMLDEFGYEGVIHYLAPYKVADRRHTVCPYASPGCRASCLYTTGRGAMHMVQDSRIKKTREFIKDRQGYADRLTAELVNLETRALKKGYTPVARLNGTSDVPWENYLPLDVFSNTRFYDYTKSELRMHQFLAGKLPDNYHLTFSYSEETAPSMVTRFLRKEGTVAVVFRNELPDKYMGIKVISGMTHDFRFRDPQGCIVGLLARGRAKHDDTGFVVD